MNLRWSTLPRQRKVLLVALAGVSLAACPRVRAEYYYLRLLTALKGPSPQAAHWSMKLDLMDRDGAVAPLLRMLRHDNPWMRTVAAESLGKHRGEKVVRALLEAASDPDEAVRAVAIESLGKIGDPLAVSTLRRLMAERGVVYTVLGRMGTEGRNALLDEARRQADPQHAAYALSIACESFPRDPIVREAVQRSLVVEAWEVRQRAVTCLGRMVGYEALPVLTKYLEDARPEVRVAAGEQVGRMGDAAGTKAVAGILRDRTYSAGQRLAAAQALATIKDERTFEVLRDVYLNDPSEGMREVAHSALRRIFVDGDPRQHGREPRTASP